MGEEKDLERATEANQPDTPQKGPGFLEMEDQEAHPDQASDQDEDPDDADNGTDLDEEDVEAKKEQQAAQAATAQSAPEGVQGSGDQDAVISHGANVGEGQGPTGGLRSGN